MKKMIIAGNWKMNMIPSAAKTFTQEIINALRQRDNKSTVILCPPFISISAVVDSIGEMAISIGAQNCHEKPKGAYTGEISASMIADAGCTYCIVGHSERRRDFGENDTLIAEKIRVLINAKLTPIWCIGESLEERTNGKTFEIIEKQLTTTLGELKDIDCSGIIIAYEPIWAIGTGLAATPGQAQEVHEFIYTILTGYNLNLPILYGGSVTGDNAASLLSLPNVNGALVGGASLSVESFTGIIDAANKQLH